MNSAVTPALNRARVVSKVAGATSQAERILIPLNDVLTPGGRFLKRRLDLDRRLPWKGSWLPLRAWEEWIKVEGKPDVSGALRLLISQESSVKTALSLLHISVSCEDRYPTWEELKDVRAAFFPHDIDVMMMLPKSENYVNLHENCFHLYQCPKEWENL